MQKCKEPSGFFINNTRAFHDEEEGLMALLLITPQFIILPIIVLRDYGGIVLSVLVQSLIPAESSACLPASYLVVLFIVNTQEKHRGACVASHLVGHDAFESHRVNGAP